MMRKNCWIDKEARKGGALSRLAQWPCKIGLVPTGAPYFDGADVLIAADCTAYACGHFHESFMRDRITLVGCPRLDGGDEEALVRIFSENDLKSITVVRMEVPCCDGLEKAVTRALATSGKQIPWQVITITTDGKILE